LWGGGGGGVIGERGIRPRLCQDPEGESTFLGLHVRTDVLSRDRARSPGKAPSTDGPSSSARPRKAQKCPALPVSEHNFNVGPTPPPPRWVGTRLKRRSRMGNNYFLQLGTVNPGRYRGRSTTTGWLRVCAWWLRFFKNKTRDGGRAGAAIHYRNLSEGGPSGSWFDPRLDTDPVPWHEGVEGLVRASAGNPPRCVSMRGDVARGRYGRATKAARQRGDKKNMPRLTANRATPTLSTKMARWDRVPKASGTTRNRQNVRFRIVNLMGSASSDTSLHQFDRLIVSTY